MHIVECIGEGLIHLACQRAECIGDRGCDLGDRLGGQNLSVRVQSVEVFAITAFDDLGKVDSDFARGQIDRDDSGLVFELLLDGVFDDAVECVADLNRDLCVVAADGDAADAAEIYIHANAGELIEKSFVSDDFLEGATGSVHDGIECVGDAFDSRTRNRQRAVSDDVLRSVFRAVAVRGRRDRAEFEAEVVDNLVGDSTEAELFEDSSQIDVGITEVALVDVVEVEGAVGPDSASAGLRVVVLRCVPIGIEGTGIAEVQQPATVRVADQRQ